MELPIALSTSGAADNQALASIIYVPLPWPPWPLHLSCQNCGILMKRRWQDLQTEGCFNERLGGTVRPEANASFFESGW